MHFNLDSGIATHTHICLTCGDTWDCNDPCEIVLNSNGLCESLYCDENIQ